MSSNQYFQKVNLIGPPLCESFELPTNLDLIPSHYRLYHPQKILSRQLINQFEKMDLRVKHVALFYKELSSEGIIHYDVNWTSEGWKKNNVALNWELTSTMSKMFWYQVDEIEVEPPPMPSPDERLPLRHFDLSGVHFGSRRNRNISSSKVHVLASSPLFGATLVRTDIAHSVVNTDPKHSRWTISIRFDPDFQTWQQALEKFDSLIIETE